MATISSAEQLRLFLSRPESCGLVPGVWYALTADEALVSAWPAHTVAGLLRLAPHALATLASSADMWGRQGMRWSSLTRRLAEIRKELCLEQLSFDTTADFPGGICWLTYKIPDEVCQ